MSKRDQANKPSKRFWTWQLTLRTLRTEICWRAAQKEPPSPWPDQWALKINAAPARELPVELKKCRGTPPAKRRTQSDRELSLPEMSVYLFHGTSTSRSRYLRRYFKSVGTELGIDPIVMHLLVGVDRQRR